VGREGFEPTKAEPAILQTAPFGHLGTCPFTGVLYSTCTGCQPAVRPMLPEQVRDSAPWHRVIAACEECGTVLGADCDAQPRRMHWDALL
jgi:hypothetical protein